MDKPDNPDEAGGNNTEPSKDMSDTGLDKSAAKRPPSSKFEVKKADAGNKSSSGGGLFKGLAVVALLFSAVGLGGSAYLWHLLQQAHLQQGSQGTLLQSKLQTFQGGLDTLTGSVQQIKGSVQQIKGSVQQVKNGLSSADNKIKISDAKSLQTEKRVNSIGIQMAEITGNNRIDWMSKEIEHFVMLAEQRLDLLGDIGGAQALLEAADKIVLKMNEPAARQLRQALAKDIASLKLAATGKVDVEGIFARLDVLANDVPKLTVSGVDYHVEEPAKHEGQTEVDTPLSRWTQFKEKFFGFLRSLVRVQRNNGSVKPLLLPDQRVWVEQGLILLLEQAQLSLLRSNGDSYLISLKEVGDRIRHYFRVDTPLVKTMLGALATLESVDIEQKTPDINASVRAAQVFREFWLKEKVERKTQRSAVDADNSASGKTSNLETGNKEAKN